MGINIRPEERDESNLTRLTIDYKTSKVETPNRFLKNSWVPFSFFLRIISAYCLVK